jgi:hypothetical protein
MTPVLAFLYGRDSSKTRPIEDIESDAQAYLFHWPAKSEEELRRLFQNQYDAAQLLFLYYYDAASKLFPENCCWAKDRSEELCRAISRSLKGKCESKLLERFCEGLPMGQGGGKDPNVENS